MPSRWARSRPRGSERCPSPASPRPRPRRRAARTPTRSRAASAGSCRPRAAAVRPRRRPSFATGAARAGGPPAACRPGRSALKLLAATSALPRRNAGAWPRWRFWRTTRGSIGCPEAEAPQTATPPRKRTDCWTAASKPILRLRRYPLRAARQMLAQARGLSGAGGENSQRWREASGLRDAAPPSLACRRLPTTRRRMSRHQRRRRREPRSCGRLSRPASGV